AGEPVVGDALAPAIDAAEAHASEDAFLACRRAEGHAERPHQRHLDQRELDRVDPAHVAAPSGSANTYAERSRSKAIPTRPAARQPSMADAIASRHRSARAASPARSSGYSQGIAIAVGPFPERPVTSGSPSLSTIRSSAPSTGRGPGSRRRSHAMNAR